MKLLFKTFFFIFLLIILAEGCSHKISTVANDSAEVKSRDLDNIDSDGDGILDINDLEINSFNGCPVDAFGKMLDSDFDGIVDCKDEYPFIPISETVRPLSDTLKPLDKTSTIITTGTTTSKTQSGQVLNNETKRREIREITESKTIREKKKESSINQINLPCDQELSKGGFVKFDPIPDTMEVGKIYPYNVTLDDSINIKTLLISINRSIEKPITLDEVKFKDRDTIQGVIFQKIDVGAKMQVVLLADSAHFKIDSLAANSIQKICKASPSPSWDWNITPKPPSGLKQLSFIIYRIDDENRTVYKSHTEDIEVVIIDENIATRWYYNPMIWAFSFLGTALLGFVFFKIKKEKPEENKKTTPTKTVIPPFVPIPTNIKKKKVFLSYAHEDEPWKEKLDNHLSALKLTDMIETWNDRKIPIGEVWDDIIVKELLEADIILILISSDFLASDYIFEKELPKAIERHDIGVAKVIPIYIRDCDFRGLPFERLEGFPKDGIAVASHEEHLQDAALKEVSLGIRTIVEFQE